MFLNNIIAGNTTGLEVEFDTVPTWMNNLVGGNGTDYTGIANQTGTNGNISGVPSFACLSTLDFHLRVGSLGIDAGNNSAPQLPAVDFDGRNRIVAGQSNCAAIVDMGAFEFDPALPLASCSPPTITCLDFSGPDHLPTECGTPATLEVSVGQSNGDALRAVWKVNGTIMQQDAVEATTIPLLTRLSFTAILPAGTNLIEVTVSDSTTNVSCSTMVVVVDTVPPIIDCPTNRVVNLLSTGGASVFFTVIATDICAGIVGIVCDPPSGSFFNMGTTTVTCVATDLSSNLTHCIFDVTVRLPLSSKATVLNEMEALANARQGEPLLALNKAISRLRLSIEADNWLSELRLKPEKGGSVFGNEAAVVRYLKTLLRTKRDGIPDETLQQWIDRIIAVDQTVADQQIKDAIVIGVAPKKSAAALRMLSRGDLAANREHSVEAILLYRDAWREAIRATARVQK